MNERAGPYDAVCQHVLAKASLGHSPARHRFGPLKARKRTAANDGEGINDLVKRIRGTPELNYKGPPVA